MTTYVKTDYVPDDCDYLTVGKEYEIVKEFGDIGGDFFDDDGLRRHCNYCCSGHIDDKPWTVINR